MKEVLAFLQDLELNNNREWFKSNEKRYKKAKTEFEHLVTKFIIEISKFEPEISGLVAKDCIFRINRDVRFSTNKDPYKNNFGAYISRSGRKSQFAGYYFHIEPGNSFAGGGIYMPDNEILKKIRTEITETPDEFIGIINENEFKNTFGEIYGEKLKTKPKGFDEFEHPELIRHKHYAVVHHITDEELTKSNLVEKTIQIFKIQKTFNDYLNRVFL
ncbi:MAG: DUF2461 domain-containing protein [Bacteroidales bacterium]|nr:DUF2461 domain-containing protein [Bacteroidales bacterium]